jgi:PTH1 family peptidyl-tRNA hydrolase
MYLVFGLGNPGRKFAGTRHNMGFETIDKIARDYNIKIKATKFDAYAGETFLHGQKAVLIKPDTYMNLSGLAVKKFVRYYKMPPEDFAEKLIIIYDDTDLSPGQIRIRQRGSAGGHNGMKNILYHLETEDFLRIRIGVGGKPLGWEQSDHVLSRFADKDEETAAVKGILTAVKALEDIIGHGAGFAMNKYNGAEIVGESKGEPPCPVQATE